MDKFRFRSTLDDAVFVVVILAGVAVSIAMEVGALRPIVEHGLASATAAAKASDGSLRRVAAASAAARAAGVRAPARAAAERRAST